MGMAGGAFEGDRIRAEQAMRAAQLAQQAQSQQFNQQMELQKVQQEQQRYADAQAEKAEQQKLADDRYQQEWDAKQQQQAFENNFKVSQFNAQREDKMYDRFANQQKMYNEYADVGRQSKQRMQQQRDDMTAGLSSVIRYAWENGGTAPRSHCENLSRQMGMDGRTSAIAGMYHTNNGNFVIDVMRMQPDGSTRMMQEVIDMPQQAKLINDNMGAFGWDYANQFRDRMAKSGYRQSEIDGLMPGYNEKVNQARLHELNEFAKIQKLENENFDRKVKAYDTEQKWNNANSSRVSKDRYNALRAIDGQLKIFQDPAKSALVYGSPEAADKQFKELLGLRTTLLKSLGGVEEDKGGGGIKGNPKQNKQVQTGNSYADAVRVGQSKKDGEMFMVNGQTFKVETRNGKRGIVKVGNNN